MGGAGGSKAASERIKAYGEKYVDEEGTGIDIIKVSNKGKKAKIIDIKSEAESGDDEESPLMIDLGHAV